MADHDVDLQAMALPDPVDVPPDTALVPPGRSPRRQLGLAIAFVLGSIVLLTLVGGVDAVGHLAAHLLPGAEGCGGG